MDLALNNEQRLICLKTKPSTNGDVMPPFIFAKDLTPNTDAYITCLDQVMLPWMMDSSRTVLCDTTGEPSLGCEKIFCDHITLNIQPSNSPGCNPQLIIFGARLSERPTKLLANSKMS